MKVYVAYFVWKGVLEAVEVHTDPVAANTRADEWRKEGNPEEMAVDVLVAQVRGSVVLTTADLPIVLTQGDRRYSIGDYSHPPGMHNGGTPLRELHLTDMYYHRLKRLGYTTVEQLCATSTSSPSLALALIMKTWT